MDALSFDRNKIGPLVLDLLLNPKHTIWLAPLLLLIDAVLCALIIRTTSYTEIDWTSYMQQIQQYHDGERDYELIKGDTGPLVYPAGHVYVYRMLYYLTKEGTSILLAQVYFAILYICNLGMVMQCYRLAKVPPYIFPMLILSKRLHSIYVLRCFNDCWAMGAFFLAIYCFQNREWTYGALAFSFGMGVKMSLLLALPAVCIILYQAKGPFGALSQVSWMLQLQLAMGAPFLRKNFKGYLSRAFDLTRQFKYQWTVNWKFLDEETFLSRDFSIALIAAHVLTLSLFVFTRYFRPLGRSPQELVRKAMRNPDATTQKRIIEYMSSDYVMTTMLSSMAIGMLFARSLHYQFYSWIAWATPFLLWRSNMNPLLAWLIWFGQEMAWNVYPPNELTSKIVVGILAATVIKVWVGSDEEMPEYVEPNLDMDKKDQ